jgi:hypothetical protein
MDQIRCPILVQYAHGEFGSGAGKSAEADVVVRPIAAGLIAVWIAGPVVELRAQQHVDRQAVPGGGASERALRHLRQGGAFANDFNMGELLDDVPVTGEHDPDVAPGT